MSLVAVLLMQILVTEPVPGESSGPLRGREEIGNDWILLYDYFLPNVVPSSSESCGIHLRRNGIWLGITWSRELTGHERIELLYSVRGQLGVRRFDDFRLFFRTDDHLYQLEGRISQDDDPYIRGPVFHSEITEMEFIRDVADANRLAVEAPTIVSPGYRSIPERTTHYEAFAQEGRDNFPDLTRQISLRGSARALSRLDECMMSVRPYSPGVMQLGIYSEDDRAAE